jgi:NAD(P)-dependent dehydrogenase (short-subunit alcohol dehydrogenase family)
MADMTAAKSAVMNLTKSLAVEWAPYDIRVNGVAPGYVAGAEAGPVAEEDIAPVIPGGRLCEPHEIAWLTAYICSPFAAYLTGHTFVIDGASWERPGRSPPLWEPIRARYERAATKG